jgi:hypothetical protein
MDKTVPSEKPLLDEMVKNFDPFLPDDTKENLKRCLAGAALLAICNVYGVKWPELHARLRNDQKS